MEYEKTAIGTYIEKETVDQIRRIFDELLSIITSHSKTIPRVVLIEALVNLTVYVVQSCGFQKESLIESIDNVWDAQYKKIQGIEDPTN